MKKNKRSGLLSTAMALICAFTCTACAQGGSENQSVTKVVKYQEGMSYVQTVKGTPVPYTSHYFDITGGKDVMPIGGFHGPFVSGGSKNGNDMPNHMEEPTVSALSECGINVIVYTGSRQEHYPYAFEELLKLGEKYGMGFYLNLIYLDELIGGRSPAPLEEVPTEQLYSHIVDASYDFKYKSLLGFQLSDELFPSNQLKNAIKVIGALNSMGLPLDYYSNAGGWYDADFDWFGLANVTYDEYVAEFSKMNLKVFSNTIYPYDTASTTDEGSHQTLKQAFIEFNHARKSSLENGMTFWRMMQAGHQWKGMVESEPYAPNEGEFLFDANISLLFGAKGIQFYTCVQYPAEATLPDGTFDSQRNGLIGINGKKTQWWYYCKKFTTQVQAIDHILMNSASMGFIPHGEEAFGLCSGIEGEDVVLDNFRELKKISGDSCFVGCYDYLGGSAYLVTNASRNNKAAVNLDFDNQYCYDVTQRGKTVTVVGTNMDLLLQPGEAVMVALR
ncbi:MAG: hypothetical protein E7348_04320 [Clostridiales bacterium]|nr:hypothetical protein [Clostridiales bacterium]